MPDEPIQDLEAEVQNEARRTADTAKQAMSRAKNSARRAAHDLKEAAIDLKDRARDVADEGQVRARRYYDAFDGRVRSEPIKAAGVALGVGVLMGLLLRTAAPHGQHRRELSHH